MSAATSPSALPETWPSASPSPDPRLRRCLGWVVLLITSGYTFLDYWSYSRTFHDGGGVEWEKLLAGQGIAPAQYRIGVLRVAALLATLTHTHLRHMFAVIDFVCLGLSVALLLWLLSRSNVFRSASRTGQWLQAALALGCVLLYLSWTFWYQKPETHATLLLLVLSAVAAQWHQRIPAALALIAVAALGATVRADAVVAFHAGFLAACLLPQARTLPLGRTTQIAASGLSIVAAIGVQYAIMHWLYPHAAREVSAFQLLSNLRYLMDYVVLVCALFPWWMTLRLAARQWRALDGWSVALVLGSIVHFLLFYIIGMASEVRIFLPYAMTLIPLTVTLAYSAIDRTSPAPPTP